MESRIQKRICDQRSEKADSNLSFMRQQCKQDGQIKDRDIWTYRLMFPSSCSVSSDIWTPVMWRLGRKLNLIFGFVYFCLFVMWMHICGSLPSLFIDQPLEQARGASHGNPCECIDVIWKDLVCLIWCCPSCSHRLCTSLFILIFCFGSLLILSPCSLPYLVLAPFPQLCSPCSWLPDFPTLPGLWTRLLSTLPRPTFLQDWPMCPKRCSLLPRGGGCFMCYVNKDCQISASCLPNTIQWQWHCTHSFPAATVLKKQQGRVSQCQLPAITLIQTGMDWQ